LSWDGLERRTLKGVKEFKRLSYSHYGQDVYTSKIFYQVEREREREREVLERYLSLGLSQVPIMS
jgi:hypothetical protein